MTNFPVQFALGYLLFDWLLVIFSLYEISDFLQKMSEPLLLKSADKIARTFDDAFSIQSAGSDSQKVTKYLEDGMDLLNGAEDLTRKTISQAPIEINTANNRVNSLEAKIRQLKIERDKKISQAETDAEKKRIYDEYQNKINGVNIAIYKIKNEKKDILDFLDGAQQAKGDIQEWKNKFYDLMDQLEVCQGLSGEKDLPHPLLQRACPVGIGPIKAEMEQKADQAIVQYDINNKQNVAVVTINNTATQITRDYVAHSGTPSKSGTIVSPQEDNRKRYFGFPEKAQDDSERKLMEFFADRYDGKQPVVELILYSSRPTCKYCATLPGRFRNMHPSVNLTWVDSTGKCY